MIINTASITMLKIGKVINMQFVLSYFVAVSVVSLGSG
jgi:hypothetical protein